MSSNVSSDERVPEGRPAKADQEDEIIVGRSPVSQGRPPASRRALPVAEGQGDAAPIQGRAASTGQAAASPPPRRSRGLLLGIIGLGVGICLLGVGGMVWSRMGTKPRELTQAPVPVTPTPVSTAAAVVPNESKQEASTPASLPSPPAANPMEKPAQKPANDEKPPEKNDPPPRPPKPPKPAPVTPKPGSLGSTGAVTVWFSELGGRQIFPGSSPQLNGVSLPASQLVSRPWTLLLPPGRHALATGSKTESAAPVAAFSQWYERRVEDFQADDKWNLAKLVDAIRPTGGVFLDPILANFWGNYCWQEDRREEAVRHWHWAIRLEPAFAPAHLNLAFAHLERKELPQAQRETALASAFNAQDGYGLGDLLLQLRERLGFEGAIVEPATFNAASYELPQEPLNAQEQQVLGFYLSVAEFGRAPRVKAIALNNAGVYALQIAKKPQVALRLFQDAQVVIARSDEAPAKELTAQVLKNLHAAAKQAKYTEAVLYGRLQEYY